MDICVGGAYLIWPECLEVVIAFFQTVFCFLHFLNFLLHLSCWAQQCWAPDKLLNSVSSKRPSRPVCRWTGHLYKHWHFCISSSSSYTTIWQTYFLKGSQIKGIGSATKRTVCWEESRLLGWECFLLLRDIELTKGMMSVGFGPQLFHTESLTVEWIVHSYCTDCSPQYWPLFCFISLSLFFFGTFFLTMAFASWLWVTVWTCYMLCFFELLYFELLLLLPPASAWYLLVSLVTGAENTALAASIWDCTLLWNFLSSYFLFSSDKVSPLSLSPCTCIKTSHS